MPSTREKANDTDTAKKTDATKKSSTRKLSKTKTTGMTRKSNTASFKNADAVTKKALIAKLAELEDRLLKKEQDARSSHPRHWTNVCQGNYMLSILKQSTSY